VIRATESNGQRIEKGKPIGRVPPAMATHLMPLMAQKLVRLPLANIDYCLPAVQSKKNKGTHQFFENTIERKNPQETGQASE